VHHIGRAVTAGAGRARPTGRFVDEAVNRGRDELIFMFHGDRISAVSGLEDTLDRFHQLGLGPGRE
jgi:hypothetical protein